MLNFNKFFILTMFVFLAFTKINAENQSKPSVKIETLNDLLLPDSQGFIFKFKNFPKNKDITILYKHPISRNYLEYKKLEKIKIFSDDSIEVNDDKYIRYKGFFFDGKIFALGEEISFIFLLNDEIPIAKTSFVPRPIYVKSKEGTFSAEARLQTLTPNTNYIFYFTGLDENEKIHVKTAIMEYEIKYNSAKEIHQMVIDYQNQLGGKSKVEFSRSSGDSVVFELNWGVEVLSFLFNQLCKPTTFVQ